MPTKIYTKGGGQMTVKGDTFETAILVRPFRKMAGSIGLNGHDVWVRKSEIVACEFIPESEWAAQQAEAQKQAEDNAKRNPHPGTGPKLVVPK